MIAADGGYFRVPVRQEQGSSLSQAGDPGRQEDRKTGRPAMSVSSSASSSRKTSEARSDVDWEELCQSINTFGLEEEQVRSHLEC